MFDAWAVISIYLLALIGLLTVTAVGVAFYLVQKYDISFSITTGSKDKAQDDEQRKMREDAQTQATP